MAYLKLTSLQLFAKSTKYDIFEGSKYYTPSRAFRMSLQRSDFHLYVFEADLTSLFTIQL